MEELIFFGVIIFFSILESIARSRKAKERAESGEAEPAQFEWAQETPTWDDEIPTYDDDGSYDDEVEEDDDGVPGEPLPEYSMPYGTATTAAPQPPPPPKRITTREEAASEILAELRKLGLNVPGQGRAETRSIPKQSPPLPTPEPEPPPLPVPTRTRVPPRPTPARPDHRIHRSHAGYGTDPSERPPSEQDGLDPLAERLSADAAAVRSQLLSDRASALRQAIILHEVLGTPKGMRDEL